jgi:hypothetical protein
MDTLKRRIRAAENTDQNELATTADRARLRATMIDGALEDIFNELIHGDRELTEEDADLLRAASTALMNVQRTLATIANRNKR